MYQLTGRDDKLYRRFCGLYRKRKKEIAGGRWDGSRYVHQFHLQDFTDEVMSAGLDVLCREDKSKLEVTDRIPIVGEVRA